MFGLAVESVDFLIAATLEEIGVDEQNFEIDPAQKIR
jgi:hypothetical protein